MGQREKRDFSCGGEETSLYEKLRHYAQADYYPFHMPGHKRRLENMVNPYEIDITEINGFDDLHHPEGILKQAQQEAATIYGSRQSFYLVNGSTAGILTAISAAVSCGGHLLMARNCHRSAYHAAYIRNLQVHYLYPEWISEAGCYGGVSPSHVEESLQADKQIQAVCIVSPTYEGMVSDIHSIAEICHRHDVVLIVDEAHGAHFPFHEEYPKSALQQGADIVIQSLHKTLPALTQTAILHLAGERVSGEKIQSYLDIYQTSSPSYVFMSSIQNCIREMDSPLGQNRMQNFVQRLQSLHQQLQQLQHLQIIDRGFFTNEQRKQYQIYDIDSSKIVIAVPPNCFFSMQGIGRELSEGDMSCEAVDCEETKSIGGVELYNLLLNRYHLQAEMCTQRYVILMTSVNDSEEGYNRLIKALLEIDNQINLEKDKKISGKYRKNVYNRDSGSVRAYNLEMNGMEGQNFRDNLETEVVKSEASRILEEKAAGNTHPECVMSIAQALETEQEEIPLQACEGKISAAYLYIYPPGIPIIAPGERVSKEVLQICLDYQKCGLKLHGLTEKRKLKVIAML